MRNKPFTEYTDEELIGHEKKIKILTIMLGTCMILLFFASVMITMMKGFTTIMILPFCLSPILIVNMTAWKKLKKEQTDRNTKNSN